jgi:hypothetical protein
MSALPEALQTRHVEATQDMPELRRAVEEECGWSNRR